MAWLRYWRWLFFVMGMLWAIMFAMDKLADRLPKSLEGIDIPVKGIIVDLPEQDERRTRFDFIVTESAQKLPSKLRLSWYYPDQPLRRGQTLVFCCQVKAATWQFESWRI
jgi:competence protein ComEC